MLTILLNILIQSDTKTEPLNCSADTALDGACVQTAYIQLSRGNLLLIELFENHIPADIEEQMICASNAATRSTPRLDVDLLTRKLPRPHT